MELSKIYKMRIFSLEDVMAAFAITKPAAAKALLRWQQKGIVQQIRKNMYTSVDLANDRPTVDKYEVGSRISATSYIGWHSALEFHGLGHQTFYTIYVGSATRFNKFSFEESDFECCTAPFEETPNDGIIIPDGNPNIRVTDLERTLVDCCDRPDRAGGVEELMHCMEGVMMLNETKLLTYLSLYGKAFLYQKMGFLIERIQKQAHISTETIETCRQKGAMYVKRMTNSPESDCYVNTWKLYVPNSCLTDNNHTDDFV